MFLWLLKRIYEKLPVHFQDRQTLLSNSEKMKFLYIIEIKKNEKGIKKNVYFCSTQVFPIKYYEIILYYIYYNNIKYFFKLTIDNLA